MRYASFAEVDKIVGEMLEMLDEDNVGDWKEKQFDIIASYLVVDLIVAASAIIAENGGEIGNVMPEILLRNFVIHAVSSRKSFIEESRRIIECVINFRDENASTKHSDAILKAKKYIADNFANPDISLQTVAKEIALSPNHFSAVFSQECGTTFIAYLTKVRVEQAKKCCARQTKKVLTFAMMWAFVIRIISVLFKKKLQECRRKITGSLSTLKIDTAARFRAFVFVFDAHC